MTGSRDSLYRASPDLSYNGITTGFELMEPYDVDEAMDDYDPLDAYETNAAPKKTSSSVHAPLPPAPPPPPPPNPPAPDSFIPLPPPIPPLPQIPIPPPPKQDYPLDGIDRTVADTDLSIRQHPAKKFDPAEEIRKSQLEREEHARRMEAENKKRKLLATKTASLGSLKLKKVAGFAAFEDDDTVPESTKSESAPKKSTQPANFGSQNSKQFVAATSTSVQTSMGIKSQTSTSAAAIEDDGELSVEQTVIIKKTAAFMVDNPDKSQLFLEKCRDDKKMTFLFERHSVAGAFYQEEYSRCKAEKEVRDVFYGPDKTTIQPLVPPALQIPANTTYKQHTDMLLQQQFHQQQLHSLQQQDQYHLQQQQQQQQQQLSQEQHNLIQQQLQQALGGLAPVVTAQHQLQQALGSAAARTPSINVASTSAVAATSLTLPHTPSSVVSTAAPVSMQLLHVSPPATTPASAAVDSGESVSTGSATGAGNVSKSKRNRWGEVPTNTVPPVALLGTGGIVAGGLSTFSSFASSPSMQSAAESVSSSSSSAYTGAAATGAAVTLTSSSSPPSSSSSLSLLSSGVVASYSNQSPPVPSTVPPIAIGSRPPPPSDPYPSHPSYPSYPSEPVVASSSSSSFPSSSSSSSSTSASTGGWGSFSSTQQISAAAAAAAAAVQLHQQQTKKLEEMTSMVLGAIGTSALPAGAVAAAKKNRAKTAAAAEAEAAAIAAETLAFAADDAGEQKLWESKVREQREMQLFEERIREAARAGMGLGGPGGVGGFRPDSAAAAVAKSGVTQAGAIGDATSDRDVSSFVVAGSKEEQLYQDRLREYDELAKRYDENFRDTIEDAERNGGIIDGGTWEHRKRAKEMLETARKNLELTALAAGRHHIADFLPQHELEKFLKKADAIVSGEKLPIESDFQEHKLGEDNLGYQMLKKAGWSEGAGLGAGAGVGGGILEPINMSGQSTETTGVGITATHEVNAADDEFDQYRKRMMLAYRFRPNPLNNPRRNYY